MPAFDHIVLTASNEMQARGYRAQVRWRQNHGLLPTATTVTVVADPGGQRVGSLGSTLHVLALLAETLSAAAPAANRDSLSARFAGHRILICHSGGDSRRTPAYAAQGKVFTPVPSPVREDQAPTLFDLILANLEKLPVPANGHVLIAVGDVLLTFDPATVVFDAPGFTGVAYAGPLSRGARHGVYVAEGAVRNGCLKVRDFLQKPDAATAAAHHALDRVGRVLVDTGLLSFGPDATASLLTAAGIRATGRRPLRIAPDGLLAAVRSGRAPQLDLYEHLTMALAPAITAADYARRFAAPSCSAARALTGFAARLRGTPFHVQVLPSCDFFHLGSSRELLTNFSPLTRTAEAYRFTNFQNSLVAAGASLEDCFVFNTVIATPAARAAGSLIEACHLDAPFELAGRNLLTGLPAHAGVTLRLPPDVGLVALPIGSRDWAAVVYGLDDDFKTDAGTIPDLRFSIDDSKNDAGTISDVRFSVLGWLRAQSKTGNRRLSAQASAGLTARELWPRGAARTAWEARLWTVGPIARVLRDALQLLDPSATPSALRAWRRRRRTSLAALMPLVNHARQMAHREELLRLTELHRLAQRLLDDDALSAAGVSAGVRSAAEAAIALDQLRLAQEQRPTPLFRARTLRLAEAILADHPGAQRHPVVCVRTRAARAAPSPETRRNAIFDAVAEAVAMDIPMPDRPRPAAIQHDQVVWVTTPARMDFAGGWSDTPPISTERGGCVLNAAITLNGQYPVQVMAKLNETGTLRLASIDLGERIEFRDTRAILDHRDPHHWAALPKAALVLAGVAPNDPRQPLRPWLKQLGAGLDLTIFSALPKGSGMGTSSILGAAVLACLGRVLGTTLTLDMLTRLTSILEQRMRTGGGWQDQVGGAVAGVKLIRTQPGPDQTLALQWTGLELCGAAGLRERMLLYFTGQKRMARNILHNVVYRYLARDPLTLETIDALKENALAMKTALDARDFERFADGVDRYWSLKKRMDPGSTNPQIEALLARIARWTRARLLPGAGGGGFLFLIANDAQDAANIRGELSARPPNALARFFDFDVDPTGLKVTVL